MCAVAILVAILIATPPASAHVGNPEPGARYPRVDPTALTISIQVVRTGPGDATVVGFTDGVNEPIDVIVNGQVATRGNVSWIGEYWFLQVPVTDAALVFTRIGATVSPTVVVPAHVPQRVAPPGFVYAQGTALVRNGTPIAMFGVNEATAFSWALLTWGYNLSEHAGKNQLFPSGPDTRIPGIATPDDLWREYFRYFLHFKQSTVPGSPPANLLRIWIADLNWGTMAYDVWRDQPSVFFGIFDRMLHWADRAGVYVVPIIGQNSIQPADNTLYDRASPGYASHLAFARDVVQHYDSDPRIAMWDLWNEADVLNDAYWALAGGIPAYRGWLTGLVADLRPYSANHLFTIGSAQWPAFPGLATPFGWRRHFAFNDIPGVDVAHEHTYFGVEDAYLLDWRAEWGEALGRPFFVGEFGYNGQVLHPLGYGYWPWFAREWKARDVGPQSAMVFVDNGKGPYADYPYFGPLPDYPNGTTPNNPPVASFVYSPPSPLAGSSVRFDASASNDDRGIAAYAWNFGDGQFGNGVVANHVFSDAGSYNVSLTVQDSDGASDIAVVPVSVDPVPDTIAPRAVVDLASESTAASNVTLRWTAPGDDGASGRATAYDLRYTTEGPIDNGTFPLATVIAAPTPGPGGSTERWTVAGLAAATRHWFALRTSDEAPNWSPLSNVVDAVPLAPTAPDITAPSLGFLQPADGSEVSGDVHLIAWADDDDAVASVSFQVDGVLWAVDASAPYEWIWRSANVADGTHRLTAIAEDASGNRARVDVDVRTYAAMSPRVTGVSWDPAHLDLEISFSKPMNRSSVEQNLQLAPLTDHLIVWRDDTRLHLILTAAAIGAGAHVVRIAPSAMDAEGIALTEEFMVALPPILEQASPVIPWILVALALIPSLVIAIAGVAHSRRRLAKMRIAASGLLDLAGLVEDRAVRSGSRSPP